MTVLTIQPLSPLDINSYHSEILGGLSTNEAESKIAELKKSGPLQPPCPGRWKLESWRYFQTPGVVYRRMSKERAEELAGRGVIRLEANGHWVRVGRLVLRWKRIPGAPVTAQYAVPQPKPVKKATFDIGALNRSKTWCKAGHELAGPNLKTTRSGRRVCRACNRLSTKLRKQRAKEKRLEGPGLPAGTNTGP
jgi:hypothetical protein